MPPYQPEETCQVEPQYGQTVYMTPEQISSEIQRLGSISKKLQENIEKTLSLWEKTFSTSHNEKVNELKRQMWKNKVKREMRLRAHQVEKIESHMHNIETLVEKVKLLRQKRQLEPTQNLDYRTDVRVMERSTAELLGDIRYRLRTDIQTCQMTEIVDFTDIITDLKAMKFFVKELKHIVFGK